MEKKRIIKATQKAIIMVKVRDNEGIISEDGGNDRSGRV